MKTYTFRIIETATYDQKGTVTVRANNKKEAVKRVIAGDYEHTGDNEILLDSERDTRNCQIIEKASSNLLRSARTHR
jgi:hypothetical protein